MKVFFEKVSGGTHDNKNRNKMIERNYTFTQKLGKRNEELINNLILLLVWNVQNLFIILKMLQGMFEVEHRVIGYSKKFKKCVTKEIFKKTVWISKKMCHGGPSISVLGH